MRTLFLTAILTGWIFVFNVHASAVVSQQQKAQRQPRNPPQQQSQAQQPQNPYRNPQENLSAYPPKNYRTIQEQGSDVVDIVQVWKELEFSSEIWPLIIDREPKELTIREYINLYHEKGIYIRNPPSYYVDLIDEILVNRPELLSSPFKNVLRFAAIVEYDFDNGKDKDQMALQLLGQTVFEENKKRLNR